VPLLPAKLADALTAVFEGRDGYPDDKEAAGKAWAAAYQGYAGGALAGVTTPVAAILDGATETLAGALASAFTTAQSNAPAAVTALGAALDLAFVAYWMTPVTFVSPPGPVIAGTVLLAPPGVLASALSSLLLSGANSSATARAQAQSLAAVLDGWTRTVTVTTTPVTPPGPPVVVPLT
jgi:hypothetical protein